MREYLFMGKRTDNGEWVTGWFYFFEGAFIRHCHQTFHINEGPQNSYTDYEVAPETIRQYIGIKDKAGNRIFENSILKGMFGTGIGCKSTKYKEFNFKVTYHGHSPEFHLEMPKNYGRYRFCPNLSDCLVIGNTFDHADLLH